MREFKLTEKQAPIATLSRTEVPEIARKRQACLALDISPPASGACAIR